MKEQPLFVALIFSFCLTVENCSICCGDDLHFHGLLSQSALSLSLFLSPWLWTQIYLHYYHISQKQTASPAKKKNPE